ncbi:hypothetical protein L6452_35759 [Arctium lappa]|uniref:Uncharacterized protein n=1 Tax=Arctium lappa TaxID=4217 RepID=A0ACB8Y8H1_ARCLA|nr:hypothetical protein L6452_35759 [Arctium lappa]
MISSGNTRGTKRKEQETTTCDAKGEHKMLPTDVKIKVKGKQQAIPDYNSDNDFKEHHNDPVRHPVACTRNSRNLKDKKLEKRVKQPRAVEGQWLVPIGGIDLTTADETDEGKELATIWKQQYQKGSPRPTDVMKKIQSSLDSRLLFKLNFILLYAEATVWENDDINTNEAPLKKWSMESLRKRQTDAIKGGGFHVAILRVTGHTLEQNHVNTNKEAPSPTNDENNDIDEKKEFIMDLNEKFSLLMRTKVDAQAVIMKAKQKFPLGSIFERYEDELAVLFNETAFRGSAKCKEAST